MAVDGVKSWWGQRRRFAGRMGAPALIWAAVIGASGREWRRP